MDEVYCFECELHKPEKCFSEKGLGRRFSICEACEKKADECKPSSVSCRKQNAKKYIKGDLPYWMYS